MARWYLYSQIMVVLLGVVLVPALAWCLPQGTVISNTAQATYNLGATNGLVSSSNTVTTSTVVVRTPSTLAFLQYAPTLTSADLLPVSQTAYSTTGAAAGPFSLLAPPIPSGSSTPLDIEYWQIEKV